MDRPSPDRPDREALARAYAARRAPMGVYRVRSVRLRVLEALWLERLAPFAPGGYTPRPPRWP